MLKLSKDQTKVKRRINFCKDSINQKEIDENTIYVEDFPDDFDIEKLASIFSRVGSIMHIHLPKFQNS